MKKLLFVIVFFIFCGISISQTVNESPFLEAGYQEYPQYDMRYDKTTGTYVYTYYDTTINKSMFLSNKGNSKYYDYCGAYNVQFNSKGDYFGTGSTFAEDYANDKTHIIANGIELRTYSYIDPIIIKDDILYVIAKNDNKSVFVKYNTMTKKFEYEKTYDEINLVYLSEEIYTEPYFELGFTKDGKEYFAAKDNNKQFLVIGGIEQEKFDEINPYGVTPDKIGEITYIATKITDDIRESFVIQGTKRYRSFPSIIEYIRFTNDNIPVYGISDDTTYSYFTKQYVTGNNPMKSYNAGVWGLDNTPSGKIFYIASDSTADGKYTSRLVIDGIEGKSYDAVYNVRFDNKDKPVFIVTKNQMEVLVYDNEEIGTEYNYIFGLTISPDGNIGYIGTISGDEGAKIPERYFVIIDGKRYGPFLSVPYGLMEGFFEAITFNESGNYAFAATDEKSKTYDNQKFTVYSNKFNSPGSFNYVNEIIAYNNDFYYSTASELSETVTEYNIFKNGNKIAGGYTALMDYKLDKENGIITFIGVKNYNYMYVEIKL
ncbi:MAG: hypothetical protein JW917_06055 [Ignavibacteria bacterium]|nr:hypothetical protein [Ignavibacteria bacterium]